MGALDEPDSYTFMRGGVDKRKAEPERRAAWASVLRDSALARHLEVDGLAAAQRRLGAYRQRSRPGLKPGITRGGKPVEGGGNA